ncbi:MAG: hypothetical protein JWN40_5368 [Phycisphaerales bacterium]|nr:hypothetical protein [Phycisphaerales bacterium]
MYGIDGIVATACLQIRYLLTLVASIVVTGTRSTLYSTTMTPPVITRVRIRLRDSAPLDPADDFADWVRQQLDGPVLRYSTRLILLKEAERRRLGRFEANLIIASVLHRAGMGQEYELRPPAMEWIAPVMTFVVLQSALVLGAWWVLR